MNHSIAKSLTLVAASLFLASCGGGGGGGAPGGDNTPPTAAIDVQSGALERSRALVVRFSESMNTASVRLSGELGEKALPTWSRGGAENDTLTLVPRGGSWPVGPGRLSIGGTDLAGNAMTAIQESYVVRLALSDFQAADVVMGQADFQSEARAPTAPSSISSPYGSVAIAPDGRLFVADYGDNRVLVFAGVPDQNNAPAILALGQADLVSSAGGSGRSLMNGPQGTSIGNGKLVVTDYENDRVLLYQTIPSAAGALPDVVLGKADFSDAAVGCGAGLMVNPESALITDDGKVLVADAGNHRVLIWNQPPTSHGQAPDVIVGQADADHCASNDDDQDGNPGNPTARTFNYPAGVWSDGRRLVVVDQDNSRALVWNALPTSNFQPADLVLGQTSFSGRTVNDADGDGATDATASAATLNRPYIGVSSNGVQLAISDTANHRVLVWNSFPTRSAQPADRVIGQGSFAHAQADDDDQDGASDGSPSSRTLHSPVGVTFHGDRLFVSDGNNHRVLIFRSR